MLLFSVAKQNEIRAILHIPEKQISIENPNSQLVKILPVEDDFSREFVWSHVLIQEFNYESGEIAGSIFDGFYKRFSLLVVTEIQQFKNKAELDESSVEAYFAFPATGELSNLELMKVSDSQKSSCYYWIDGYSECDVVIVYDDKVIGLEVKLETGADKSILQQITNNVLLAIKDGFE